MFDTGVRRGTITLHILVNLRVPIQLYCLGRLPTDRIGNQLFICGKNGSWVAVAIEGVGDDSCRG